MTTDNGPFYKTTNDHLYYALFYARERIWGNQLLKTDKEGDRLKLNSFPRQFRAVIDKSFDAEFEDMCVLLYRSTNALLKGKKLELPEPEIIRGITVTKIHEIAGDFNDNDYIGQYMRKIMADFDNEYGFRRQTRDLPHFSGMAAKLLLGLANCARLDIRMTDEMMPHIEKIYDTLRDIGAELYPLAAYDGMRSMPSLARGGMPLNQTSLDFLRVALPAYDKFDGLRLTVFFITAAARFAAIAPDGRADAPFLENAVSMAQHFAEHDAKPRLEFMIEQTLADPNSLKHKVSPTAWGELYDAFRNLGLPIRKDTRLHDLVIPNLPASMRMELRCK